MPSVRGEHRRVRRPKPHYLAIRGGQPPIHRALVEAHLEQAGVRLAELAGRSPVARHLALVSLRSALMLGGLLWLEFGSE